MQDTRMQQHANDLFLQVLYWYQRSALLHGLRRVLTPNMPEDLCSLASHPWTEEVMVCMEQEERTSRRCDCSR